MDELPDYETNVVRTLASLIGDSDRFKVIRALFDKEYAKNLVEDESKKGDYKRILKNVILGAFKDALVTQVVLHYSCYGNTPSTAEELASKLRRNLESTEIVCHCLHANKLMNKEGQEYNLADKVYNDFKNIYDSE